MNIPKYLSVCVFLFLLARTGNCQGIPPGETVKERIKISESGETFTNEGTIEQHMDTAAVLVDKAKGAKVFNYGNIFSLSHGYGIRVKQADYIEITNTGTISISGKNAYAINVSGGDGAVINNSGKVLTKEKYSYAIRVNGDENVIINDGSISTRGNQSHCIHPLGKNNKILNTDKGKISTVGDSSNAIKAKGDATRIINKGLLKTSGSNSDAIQNKGRNLRIENYGEIFTSAAHSYAIHVYGSGAVIDNSGIIRTKGKDSLGIQVNGGDVRIRNAGDIITTKSTGIHVKGSSVEMLNEGRIVNADGGTGMAFFYNKKASTANSARDTLPRALFDIRNTGEIRTAGMNGNGIFAYADRGIIENCGAIVTDGDGAHGIEVHGSSNRIVNSGVIKTSGQQANGIKEQRVLPAMNANGMDANGGDADASSGAMEIVNTGVISTSGKGSYGIDAQDDNATIVNKGKIESSKGAGAIHAEGHDATVELAAGSRTSGKIKFDHPEDAHLQVDIQNGLASFEIDGMPKTDAMSSVNPAAISGHRFTEIAAQDLLSSVPAATEALAATVSAAIDARLDRAGGRLLPTGHGRKARSLWIMPFSRRLRGEDFDHLSGGMIVGRGRAIPSNRGRYGLLGGFSIGRTNAGKGPSGDLGNVFGGLYREMPTHSLDLSLVGGYMNAREKLRVSGAPFSFASDYLYINPSVRFYKDYVLGNGVLIPSVRASYFGLVQLGNSNVSRTGLGRTGLNVSHRTLQRFDVGYSLRYGLASFLRGAQVLLHVDVGVDGILPLGDTVRVYGNVKSASFSPDHKTIVREHLGADIALDFRDGARLSTGIAVGYDNIRTLLESAFLKLTYSF